MMHKSKAPAFQFYYRDFATSTAFMSGEAVGALIQMLGLQFEHGGIPNDVAMLARATRCSEKAVEEAMTKFDLSDDGKLRNARMIAVVADMERYRQKQASNSGKRWGSKKSEESDAVGIPPDESGIDLVSPRYMPNACPASAPPSPPPSETPKRNTLRHPPQNEQINLHGVSQPAHRAAADPIWDVVAELWHGGKVIEAHKSAANRVVRSFREMNASPDDIRKRHGNWNKVFTRGVPTANAVIKHWHALDPPPVDDRPAWLKFQIAEADREIAEAEAKKKQQEQKHG
jgi:uncharacterized protein YdaU (DUF1376 family)